MKKYLLISMTVVLSQFIGIANSASITVDDTNIATTGENTKITINYDISQHFESVWVQCDTTGKHFAVYCNISCGSSPARTFNLDDGEAKVCSYSYESRFDGPFSLTGSFKYGNTPIETYTAIISISNVVTINTVPDGQQLSPVTAINEQVSQQIIVWADDQNTNGSYEIMARGLYAGGTERFADITVNSNSSGNQRNPDVAVDNNGNFVVVWEDDQDGNGYYEIMARGFNAGGTERFSDITVNSIGSGQQLNPKVDVDNDGNFVVVWQDDKDNNNYYNILARGFYSNGSQKISDFRVNSVAAGQQLKPDVAVGDSGVFTVTWQDDKDNNNYYNILARGFYHNGVESFSDLTVHSISSGQQLSPSISADGQGNTVIVWEDDNDNNGAYQILARGFTSLGVSDINDFTVNSVSAGQQLKPIVSRNNSGEFAVTWIDDQDGNGYFEILARGFDLYGNETIADTVVNSVSSGTQGAPSIAMYRDGYGLEFWVTWQDDQDGNGFYQILGSSFK